MNDKSNTPPDGWKVVSKENRHSMLAYQCRSKHCGTPWVTTRKGAIEAAHAAVEYARATDPEKAELREENERLRQQNALISIATPSPPVATTTVAGSMTMKEDV